MKQINFLFRASICIVMASSIISCDDETNVKNLTNFTITVQNTSTTSTLQPGALPDRTAPLSHGVWAVLNSGNLFNVDQPSDEGTSRIAEDGMTTVKTNELNNSVKVESNGEFVAPGGPDNGAAIFAGESSTFMIQAEPGDKLQIQTMFIQSNDWFYSFDNGGLDLFNGDSPVTGDVTSKLVLYDAGTEIDEMLGLGQTQKLDQDPLAFNIGANDAVNLVKVATVKHPGFIIPSTASVIKITITADPN